MPPNSCPQILSSEWQHGHGIGIHNMALVLSYVYIVFKGPDLSCLNRWGESRAIRGLKSESLLVISTGWLHIATDAVSDMLHLRLAHSRFSFYGGSPATVLQRARVSPKFQLALWISFSQWLNEAFRCDCLEAWRQGHYHWNPTTTNTTNMRNAELEGWKQENLMLAMLLVKLARPARASRLRLQISVRHHELLAVGTLHLVLAIILLRGDEAIMPIR